jgi:hypothetical protein
MWHNKIYNYLLVLFLWFLVFLPEFSLAEESRSDAKTVVDLLIKVLKYDHNLTVRCPDEIRIGVISRTGNQDSLSFAQKIVDAFKANSRRKLKGLKIVVEPVEVSSPSEIFKVVDEKNINNLYFSSGLGEILPAATKFATVKNILTMSGESDCTRSKIGVCVISRSQKPKLVINPNIAKQQGAKIDGSLLLISRMLDKKPVFKKWETVRKKRIKGRDPVYPRIARVAKLEAKLAVKIFITAEGKVGKIKFIKTNEYFEQEVRDAISTWMFSPFVENNSPVPIYTVYKFGFKLN